MLKIRHNIAAIGVVRPHILVMTMTSILEPTQEKSLSSVPMLQHVLSEQQIAQALQNMFADITALFQIEIIYETESVVSSSFI